MIKISPTPRDLRDIQEALKDLRLLGVDTSDLNDINTLAARARELRARQQELQRRKASAPSALRAQALSLASTDDAKGPVETQESLERELQVVVEASNEVQSRAWTALIAQGDRNLELLRPVYFTAAQQLIDLAPALDGIKTIEQAARAGVAQQWLDAEEAHVTVKAVQKLHLQWLADGIVRNRGARSKHEHGKLDHYVAHEFHYENPDIAAEMPVSKTDATGEAHRLAAAGVALRSIKEVDSMISPRPTADTSTQQTGAYHDADDLKKQARTAQQSRNLGVKVFQ